MGYCNRCGEISSSGKCRKCGGKPVASIATGLGTDNSLLAADKWQSQYANSILGPTPDKPLAIENTMSTPLTKRNSIQSFGKPLSVSLQKTCAICNKRLRYDMPSFLEGDAHYCKECHIKSFSKGYCASCQQPVFPRRDAFVEHGEDVWHKDCFHCHNCLSPFGQVPMVDLKGRPCCEPCLMAQAEEEDSQQKRKTHSIARLSSPPYTTASTTSTPVLSPGSSVRSRDTITSTNSSSWLPPRSHHQRPKIDSQLFHHYQKSVNNNHHSIEPSLPPTLSASPVHSERSLISGSPMSISSVSSGLKTPSPSPSPLASTPPSPKSNQPIARRRTTSSTSPVFADDSLSAQQVSRVCIACNDPLSGPRIRLPMPNGDMWYHYNCLTCAGCHGHFTQSEFVSHGKAVYHPQCCPSPAAKTKATSTPRYVCHTCEKPITDKCLKNGPRCYHVQCFQCHGCRAVLPYDQPFYEIKGKEHCESCNKLARRTSLPITTSVSTPPSLPNNRSPEHPSSVLMHRTRALPKLGGSKICPSCRTSIAITEETPGPRASRWHKKCLRCAGCKKQMDSGAKVTEGENGRWLVHCRNCMDNSPRTHFVR